MILFWTCAFSTVLQVSCGIDRFPKVRYDRAITIFAPDGSLLQLEYAAKLTQKGSLAVGLTNGNDTVILAAPVISPSSCDEKIGQVDTHIFAAFSGMRADGRVLLDRARQHCQEYRLQSGEPPSVGNVARFIADIQHGFTRTGGVRPLAVACLIAGFDADGTPRLWRVEPSGFLSEWYGTVVGGGEGTNPMKNFQSLPKYSGADLSMAVMDIIEGHLQQSSQEERRQHKPNKKSRQGDGMIEIIMLQSGAFVSREIFPNIIRKVSRLEPNSPA